MINLQILTKNNESSIEKCLNSLNGIDAEIKILDIGSTDKTLKICEKYKLEILNFNFEDDFSKIRNSVICGKNLYIEPWEKVIRGYDEINKLDKNSSFYILQNGLVSKQVRFWKEGKFSNPVFESVNCKSEIRPDIVILAENPPDNRFLNTKICKKWVEKDPVYLDSHYYLACSFIAENKINEFKSEAEFYLNSEKGITDSFILMNYYLAKIEASNGNFQKSSNRILKCITFKPYMSEFWCMLGDILYINKKYQKAYHIYDDAIIVGEKRPTNDFLPIEISKYKEYPNKMKNNCLISINNM